MPTSWSRSSRRPASLLALTALVAAAVPGLSRGDLAGRYASGQQRAGALQSAIQDDTKRIQGFEGTIGSLEQRLAVIQRSVSVQERLLARVGRDLATARRRLSQLQARYASDRRTLAAELRSEYESPAPTIVNVIVDSGGFQDLLTRMSDLRTIEHGNARATAAVKAQRLAVIAQERELATVESRRERSTAAVVVERDQVAQLRLSIVNRELAVARDRSQSTQALSSLRATLSREAAVLDQRAAAAQAAASGGAAVAPGACVNTPFVAHGGPYGFFPAPGTDYTVNQEPIIAARLDVLGRALQLQLIGISGYRSPQHSVEVGGFADDPHTQGQASDTPGVEGVPESTLEQFCLTRPFSGAREADHIQEL